MFKHSGDLLSIFVRAKLGAKVFPVKLLWLHQSKCRFLNEFSRNHILCNRNNRHSMGFTLVLGFTRFSCFSKSRFIEASNHDYWLNLNVMITGDLQWCTLVEWP